MLELLPVLLVAAATGLGTRPTLRRLPEPVDPEGKIAYAALATPRFVAVCSGLAAAGTALAGWRLPDQVQPLWWVLSGVGVVLAAVDARTTWVPTPLVRVGWALMILAVAVAALANHDWWLAARAGAGALAATTLYLVAWRVTQGGFGFGDVRFAPLIGAAAAAQSATLLIWALVSGSIIGAGHAVVQLARRRSEAFPYAPSMLAGAYLACVLTGP